MTTGKEVTVRDSALPTSLDETRGLADAFVKSGMFEGSKDMAQAIVKIQAGRELGIPPVYAMQNINLIRGRLTTSANTLAMLVKRSGRYNYRIVNHTDTECKIEFFEKYGEKWEHAGWSTFTMDDAKRAGLVKPDSGWTKFPRAMLFSRAISQGARIYAPDAIGGVYTDEEIRAIPPRPGEEPEPIEAIPEASPEASPEAQNRPSPPSTEQTGQISQAAPKQPVESEEELRDMAWFKTSLETLQWADVGKYLKVTYGVTGQSKSELIKALSSEQREAFRDVVKKRLEKDRKAE